jgi:lipopolysaccharide transport protein LptA
MRNKRWLAALAAGAWAGLGLLPGAAQSAAEAGAGTNSTVITSKRLDFDYPKRVAVFEGDVVVVDAQVRIEADTITAVFDAANAPETITATGNVRIIQTDRVAVCARAVYSMKSGLLVLTGKPRISRGNDLLEGSRIVFKRDEDKVTCDDAVLRILPGQGMGFGELMRK